MDDTDPETMVQAIAHLRELGYDRDLDVRERQLVMRDGDAFVPFGGDHVEHVFRFEGPSDPSDESIVLGIGGGPAGAKGVLVSTYGPESEDSGHDAVLRSLDLGGRWT